MDIQVSGFFGLLILAADIWAILNVVQSQTDNFNKLLWILAILLLPLLGLVIWFFFGPRSR
jgi:hypothetical protein